MSIEGTVLGGRYRILELVGGGGMGQVYAAEQIDLGRRVAVKLIHPKRLGPDDLARFRREALAAARLGHPNIVQVTDFQTLPGEPALLVMELLEGEPLVDVLARERTLTEKRARFIATQVLSALAAAHAAGVVHRDIKPANIFLTRTTAMADLVKLLDFGIARGPGLAGAFVTEPGSVLGTPAYMAPEQARGGQPDQRTDLYAVGVCLFEMLAGHRPHQARSHGELISVFTAGPLPSLRSVAPSVSPDLAALVDRALQRNPDDRPARALAMLAALDADATATAAAVATQAATTDAFSLGQVSGPAATTATMAEAGAAFTPPPLAGHSAPPPVEPQRAPSPVIVAAPVAPTRVSLPGPPAPEPTRGSHPGAYAQGIAHVAPLAPAPPVPLPPASPFAQGRAATLDADRNAMEATARQALIWSLAGMLLCCFPIGIIAIERGVRARARAATLGLPAPSDATIGIALGLVAMLLSIIAFIFFLLA